MNSPPQSAGEAAHRLKVAIAERNAVVRAGLLDFVKKDGRFEIVGTVESGNVLLELCDQHRPLIVVCGWALSEMTAGDVLSTVRRRQLPSRVVIYCSDDNADVLRQAARGGAWGYVSRNDEPQVLLETLASVARGRLSLPYVDIERLTSDPIEQLTKRERELLGALAQGWTNQQIGSRFGISGNTVKYHLKNLYDKLGVRNRAMAVALYMSSPSTGQIELAR